MQSSQHLLLHAAGSRSTHRCRVQAQLSRSKRDNLPLAAVLPCSQGHLTKPHGVNWEQIQLSEVAQELGAGGLVTAASDDEPDADRNGSDRCYFLRLLERPGDTVLLYQLKRCPSQRGFC